MSDKAVDLTRIVSVRHGRVMRGGEGRFVASLRYG